MFSPKTMPKFFPALIIFALVFQPLPTTSAQTPTTSQPKAKVETVEKNPFIAIEELLPADTLAFAVTSNLSGLLNGYRNLAAFKLIRASLSKNDQSDPLAEADLFLSAGLKDSKVLDNSRVAIAWIAPAATPVEPAPKTVRNMRQGNEINDIPDPLIVLLIETPKLELAKQAREEFINFQTEYFGGVNKASEKKPKTEAQKIDQYANGSVGKIIGTNYVVGVPAAVERVQKLSESNAVERLTDDLEFGQARMRMMPINGWFAYVNGKAATQFLTNLPLGSIIGMRGLSALTGLQSFRSATLVSTFEREGVVDKLTLNFTEGKKTFLDAFINGPAIEFKGAALVPVGTPVYFSHSLDWLVVWDELVIPIFVTSSIVRETSAKESIAYEERMKKAENDKDDGAQPEVVDRAEKLQSELSPDKMEAAKKSFLEKLEKQLGFNPREELVKDFANEIVIAYDIPKPEKTQPDLPNEDTDEMQRSRRSNTGYAGLIAIKDRAATKSALLKLFGYAMSGFGSVSVGNENNVPDAEKTDEQFKKERAQREAATNEAYARLPKENYQKTEIVYLEGLALGLSDEYLFIADSIETIKLMIDAKEQRKSLASDANYSQAMSSSSGAGLSRLYVGPTYFSHIFGSMMGDFVNHSQKNDAQENVQDARELQFNLPATIAATAQKEGTSLKIEAFSPLGLGGSAILAWFGSTVKGKAEQNEYQARFRLRTLANAEKKYAEKHKQLFATPEELAKITGPETASFEWEVAPQNYRFECKLKPNKKGYEATATPLKYGREGRKSFFVDESGKIRFADKEGKPATADDKEDETHVYTPEVEAAAAAAAVAAEESVPPPPPPPPARPRPRKR